MRMGLSCSDKPASSRKSRVLKGVAAGSFLFFLLKGIVWLVLLVGGILWAT